MDQNPIIVSSSQDEASSDLYGSEAFFPSGSDKEAHNLPQYLSSKIIKEPTSLYHGRTTTGGGSCNTLALMPSTATNEEPETEDFSFQSFLNKSKEAPLDNYHSCEAPQPEIPACDIGVSVMVSEGLKKKINVDLMISMLTSRGIVTRLCADTDLITCASLYVDGCHPVKPAVACLVYGCKEFLSILLHDQLCASEKMSLVTRISDVKATYGCAFIVIMGLQKFLATIERSKNSDYRRLVEEEGNVMGKEVLSQPTCGGRRKRGAADRLDLVEVVKSQEGDPRAFTSKLIHDFSLENDISVLHCGSDGELAEWVTALPKAVMSSSKAQTLTCGDESRLELFLPAFAKNKRVKKSSDRESRKSHLVNQFSLLRSVTPEAASAVADKYPTFWLLYEAAAKAASANQSDFLSDIEVRKDRGILSTVKKLGPVASRQIWKFLTSDDPKTLVD